MNAIELKNFYESGLGKYACRKLRDKINLLWPEVAGEKILGVGFALPYLPLFTYGNQTLSLLPENIGGVHIEDAVQSALTDPLSLPLKNEFFDRALIIHGLEQVQNPEKLLEEIWRVLKPNGKVLVITPNEGGVWLRANSPFFKTKAYSRFKVSEYLHFNKFYVKRFSRALFFIPTRFKLINRLGENIGKIFMRPVSGILLIEAEKRIFSVRGKPIKIPFSIKDRLLRPKPAVA